MGDINNEYAINFEQNEKTWEQRQEKLHSVIRYITKNTILQFTVMDVQFRAYDLVSFLYKGERGEFLAKEIDAFLEGFDTLKRKFEDSGISDQLAELARRITNKHINNEN